MGRRPGSSNSDEHNERIAAAIRHRYQDDPDYHVLLSKQARERWNSEFYNQVTESLDELESEAASRRILVGMRYLERIIAEGKGTAPDERRFIHAVREVLSGDFITRIREEH